MSNSFGELFRITSFGESHGPCIGVVIDGCPAGLSLNEEDIQKEVDKRKPVYSAGQTARVEEDKVEVLSGVFQGRTTGAPITLLVHNRDIDSSVYEAVRFVPRPGHADYTAYMKYGGFNDYRGGGRFSGRVTVGLVMAGAVAKKLLEKLDIQVLAFTIQIGSIKAGASSLGDIIRNIQSNPLRCPDLQAAKAMAGIIEQASREGDSLGGVVEGMAFNLPVGLGEPYFDSLEGQIAKALFSIPAVKGVEFGSGFAAVARKGSENNDPFVIADGRVVSATNQAGGILGGISTGMPLVLRAAVKPTPSISKKQNTVNLQTMENAELHIKGRHDACIVPRAAVVIESMMAVTLCDFVLRAGLIARVIK
jgi:chorismate synthase